MMVSNDNQILLLILNQLSDMKRENASYYERTEQQISDMRKENADFRREMKQEMQDFKTEMKQEMQTFTQKTDGRFDAVNARFDRLEEQIAVMQDDITGLKHDVAGLYHWDYWLLSIILVVFAMPQIVAGIKSLFGALAEGISQVIGAFRKDSK